MCGRLSLDTRGTCLWFLLFISCYANPSQMQPGFSVAVCVVKNSWCYCWIPQIWWLCRSKSNQYPTTSLLQIEGVNTPEEVNWYLGKRLAYVYKAKTRKNGSLYRCTWGKVARPHGNSGVVRGRFRKNLPPASLVCDYSHLLNIASFVLV